MRLNGVVVALLVVALAGCDPLGGSDSGPRSGSGSAGGISGSAGSSSCDSQVSKTRALLPEDGFERWGDQYQATMNPCLAFLDIASTVLDLVPASEQKAARKFNVFRDKLTRVVNRLNDLKDVVQCGYQTDRLAVGIYQGRKTKWSIGAVIVIRGDADAFLSVSSCYVGKLIRNYICPGCGGGEPGQVKPVIQPCFDYERPVIGGEQYTVLWVASTNTLCEALDTKLSIDNDRDALQQAEVAAASLVVRDGPGTAYARLGSVAQGTTVYLQCYLTGDSVAAPGAEASDQWDRLTANGVTGFVAHAWLNTRDGELPADSGMVPEDTPIAGFHLAECPS